MEINETNKKLYESAFIENGEYGYHGATWNPDIDEREIETMCGPDTGGNYVPATPLGYRDYSISRLAGLKNILDQVPFVDLTDDKLHHLKREDNTIRKYDKIRTGGGDFVVTGDSEDYYYVVDEENKQFYVEWEKAESETPYTETENTNETAI